MHNVTILYFLRDELFSDSLLLPLLFELCFITVSFGALSVLLRARGVDDCAGSCLEEDLEDSTLVAEDRDPDSGVDLTTGSEALLFVTVVPEAADPLFALLLTAPVDLFKAPLPDPDDDRLILSLSWPADVFDPGLSFPVVVEDLRTVPVLWLPEGLEVLFWLTVVDDLRLVPAAWPCWVRPVALPLLTVPDDLRVEVPAEPLLCLDEETPAADLLLPEVDMVAALSGCTFA